MRIPPWTPLAAGVVLLATAGAWSYHATSQLAERPRPGPQPVPEENPSQLVPPVLVQQVSQYLEEGDLVGSGRAIAHPHGTQVCASGCAASNHPTKPLTRAEFDRLLAEFATEPMSEESEALDALLYYGRQTHLFLDRYGPAPLDSARAEFLLAELKRTHVLVEIRLIDEHDVVRVSLPPTRVPLDIRHEFTMDTVDLQPLITSGTVKRVGLNHLWQRL